MKVSVEKNELVIRIELQEPTPSASGKNLVVASTHGCVKTDCKIKGKDVVIGVNAFIKS